MLDDFLVRALLAGIGLALVTGPAGCFVVWRHLAYFGETIAHSALLGVVLALVLRVDLVIGIFASACAVTLLMFYLQRRGTLPADTVLGLLAHGGLAVGLVTLAFFPHIRIDLQALLFGDILAVSRTDLAVIWGGGALVLAVLGRIWRPLLAATVNPDLATVAGLQPERTRLIFGLLMAAVIAGAIKIVGILLIVALLVIPPATARRFASSPEQMAVAAALAGVIAIAGGTVRLGSARHAVRPVDRRGRPAAVHGDPHPSPEGVTHRRLSPSPSRLAARPVGIDIAQRAASLPQHSEGLRSVRHLVRFPERSGLPKRTAVRFLRIDPRDELRDPARGFLGFNRQNSQRRERSSAPLDHAGLHVSGIDQAGGNTGREGPIEPMDQIGVGGPRLRGAPQPGRGEPGVAAAE